MWWHMWSAKQISQMFQWWENTNMRRPTLCSFYIVMMLLRQSLFGWCCVCSWHRRLFVADSWFPRTDAMYIIPNCRGDQLRNITISKCCETIGPVQATALLGFRALTGCDQTGRFNRKTTSFWWKQFYCAGEDILAATAELSEDG